MNGDCSICGCTALRCIKVHRQYSNISSHDSYITSTNWAIVASDNGSSHVRHHAVICTNDVLLLIPLSIPYHSDRRSMVYRSISQIPQRTTNSVMHISHSTPPWIRNVLMSVPKVVYCGIWDRIIFGFVRSVYCSVPLKCQCWGWFGVKINGDTSAWPL